MKEENEGVTPNPNVKEWYDSLDPPHSLNAGKFPNNIDKFDFQGELTEDIFEQLKKEVLPKNGFPNKYVNIIAGLNSEPTVTPLYPDKMFLVYYVVDGFIPVNLFITDNEADACKYVDKANGVLDRWRDYNSKIDESNVLFEKTKLTKSVRGVYYKEIEFKKF